MKSRHIMTGSTTSNRTRIIRSLAKRVISMPPGRWPETVQAERQLREAAGDDASAMAAVDLARVSGAKIHPDRV